MTTSAVRSIGAALNLAGARAAFEAMPRSHGLVTMGSAVGWRRRHQLRLSGDPPHCQSTAASFIDTWVRHPAYQSSTPFTTHNAPRLTVPGLSGGPGWVPGRRPSRFVIASEGGLRRAPPPHARPGGNSQGGGGGCRGSLQPKSAIPLCHSLIALDRTTGGWSAAGTGPAGASRRPWQLSRSLNLPGRSSRVRRVSIQSTPKGCRHIHGPAPRRRGSAFAVQASTAGREVRG